MNRIKLFLRNWLGGTGGADAKLRELSRLKQQNHPAIQNLPEHLLAKLRDGDESVMRYPPFTEGCPAWVPSKHLLDLHGDKLRMLKGGVGFDESNYERLIYPMLLNFADLVHMLPASQHHHHRGLGGLLRHGLEVSANALNYAQCEVFDARDLPGRRDQRATVWRVAAIAAGLMHDVGKVVTDMKVVSEDGSNVWQPTIRTIPEWAELNGLERYFVRWVPDRHENHKLQSLTLVERVIPVALREWILQNGEDIYTQMTMAIAGEGEARQLTRMIKRADSASVSTDMRDHGGDASRSAAIGVPVASIILDAIKRLIGKGHWEVNKPGSPIWVSTQGVFIQWAEACPEAVKDVLTSGFKGVPRSADSLAAILIDHGIAQADNGGDTYWSIAIHMLRKRDYDKTKKDLWFKCLHIPDPLHIFSFEQRPTPISISIKSSDEISEFLSDKSAAKEAQKVPKNKPAPSASPVSSDGASLASSGDSSTPDAASGDTTEGTKPAQHSDRPNKRSASQDDEVRSALGMTPKETASSSEELIEPLTQESTDHQSDGETETVRDVGIDQIDEGESEPDEDASIEDMLIAMKLLPVSETPSKEPKALGRDLLKEAFEPKILAVTELPVAPETKVLQEQSSIDTDPQFELMEPPAPVEIPGAGKFLRLSDNAIERAKAELSALSQPLQEKVIRLFVECGELRKYTPEMRVEIPVEVESLSEDELHDFVACPLVFKSAIEGYTGITYKYRKNWVCLTYDAAFLMASYDDAFIPFDVEVPDIDSGALKRTIQKFCLPEVKENHESFYHVNKKAQTDIARYLSITPSVLLHILRVNFGSVRPSTSRATEIVFFGE